MRILHLYEFCVLGGGTDEDGAAGDERALLNGELEVADADGVAPVGAMAKVLFHEVFEGGPFLGGKVDGKPFVHIGDEGIAREGAVNKDFLFTESIFAKGDPIVTATKDFIDNVIKGEGADRLAVGIKDDRKALIILAELFHDFKNGVFFGNKPGGAAMGTERSIIRKPKKVAGISDSYDIFRGLVIDRDKRMSLKAEKVF